MEMSQLRPLPSCAVLLKHDTVMFITSLLRKEKLLQHVQMCVLDAVRKHFQLMAHDALRVILDTFVSIGIVLKTSWDLPPWRLGIALHFPHHAFSRHIASSVWS
jgi:hypothetical protein